MPWTGPDAAQWEALHLCRMEAYALRDRGETVTAQIMLMDAEVVRQYLNRERAQQLLEWQSAEWPETEGDLTVKPGRHPMADDIFDAVRPERLEI